MENENFNKDFRLSKIERAMYEDKSEKTESSFLVNWEVLPTVPKCYGEELSFDILPYESRIDT